MAGHVAQKRKRAAEDGDAESARRTLHAAAAMESDLVAFGDYLSTDRALTAQHLSVMQSALHSAGTWLRTGTGVVNPDVWRMISSLPACLPVK
jgi:hypothetical protein